MLYNSFGYRFYKGSGNKGDVFVYNSQGQLIAKYSISDNTLRLYFMPIYEGTRRLGIFEPEGISWQYCSPMTPCNITFDPCVSGSLCPKTYTLKPTRKYELTDHLNNVRVIITDQRMSVTENGITVTYYKPLIESIHDYYPFGWEKQLTMVNPYPFNYQGQLFDRELGWQYYRYRNYDPMIARFHQVEPLVDSFPMWSVYVFVHNNPIVLYENEGKDPREGNRVIDIDVHNMVVIWIGDPSPKFEVVDPALFNKAVGESFIHAPFGPGFILPSPSSEVLRHIYLFLKEASRVKGLLKHSQIHSWVVAAKSKSGYQFVEYNKDKKEFIVRRVENLNDYLGVDGFENVVTEKAVFDIKGNLKRVEYWNYTVRENNGRKKVFYEHFIIDMSSKNTGLLYRSGLIEAVPSLYKSDSDSETNIEINRQN